MSHQKSISSGTDTRIALWDNVKFVMIIFMVIGHFADGFSTTSDTCKSIFLFIYSFHMPLFIFISGLFYSEKNSRQKIVYYCCCGFALKIILSCTSFIISKTTSFSLLSDGGIPWFMFSLASYQAIMYLSKEINKKFLLIFCILLACFVGYDQSVSDWLYLSRIVIFFPFFLLGSVLSRISITAFIKRHFKTLLPISILVLILWFYLCFYKLDCFYIYRHLLTGRNPFSNQVIGYGPAARLLCYFITFATGASIIVIIPNQNVPVITTLGTRTINVLFWHWPLYRLMSEYLGINDLFTISLWGKAAYFLVAVLLSVMIMSLKPFGYPLALIKRYCLKS